MRRADGALPPNAKGKRELDLLAGQGQSRCVVACQICDALPDSSCVTATCAETSTSFGPASQSMAGDFTTCDTKLLLLCSTQFTQSSTSGLLRALTSSLPAKSACSHIFHICYIFAYFAYFSLFMHILHICFISAYFAYNCLFIPFQTQVRQQDCQEPVSRE